MTFQALISQTDQAVLSRKCLYLILLHKTALKKTLENLYIRLNAGDRVLHFGTVDLGPVFLASAHCVNFIQECG